MSKFLPLLIVATAFHMAACLAYASDGSSSPKFSKHDWKIANAYCPVGCSKKIRSFLKGYIGEMVEVSASKLNAPFLDECDGEVHIALKTTSAQTVIDEINKGMEPTRKITLKNLKIRSGPVVSGIAYCNSDDLNLPFARLLSIETDRILVLFEEHSIIELR